MHGKYLKQEKSSRAPPLNVCADRDKSVPKPGFSVRQTLPRVAYWADDNADRPGKQRFGRRDDSSSCTLSIIAAKQNS